MGRLVKANPEVEASKGQTTVVGTGTHGRLVRTGDVQRTSPTGNVVQKKPTVQPSKAATIPAKASSPMFRTRQNVVTPKNQSALAQNLAKGALQQQSAKNYQSTEALEQHAQEVKPRTTMQRVGDTVKGAAKTYASGLVNLVGMAQTGSGLQQRAAADEEIALWDQEIKTQQGVLADPKSTKIERETAQNVIDALELKRSAYLKAYGEGGEVERTAQGVYKTADKLADSGTRDIERAKKDLGGVGRLAVDVGVAGAQMGADAALGLLTGGSALPAMFVRSTGGSAQEARRAGATHQQQVNYGFASGALSVATEKIGNAAAPFKKMFGKGFLDDVIERATQNLTRSAAGKIALSFLEEGGEEVLEDLIQPALQTIYNGKTMGGSYSELEAAEVLNDFLVGGILGGLGGGVEVAANRFSGFDSTLGESGRKAIRGSYQEGTDAAKHVKDFIPAYNAGAEGKANPNPTNETAYAGYIAGQNDAKAEARKKTFAQENESGSGLVYDEYVSREMDNATADEINTVAKALGVRVRMEDQVRGGTANGEIAGNEIRIAKDAQDPVMQVVGHEWTHRVQELAPEQYTAFRSAIMEDSDVAEAANILHEQYNRMGVEISTDEALDEAAANYAGEMIANTDVLNEFIRRHSEDRTLLEKLRDAIREIVGKLTGKAKQQAQTAEGLLQQAFEAAAQNSKNAATEGGTRYSLNEFADGKRFVDVQTEQSQFDGLDDKQKTKRAIQVIKEKFAGKVIGIDNRVFVNGRSAAEYGHPSKNISSDIRDAKMRASTELDNLIDAGTNFRTAPDGKDGHVHPNAVGDFQYFDTTFKVGNEYYKGTVNIEPVSKGLLLKDITKIENITQDISSSYGQNPKSTFLRDASMDSIRTDGENVNGDYSLEGAENGKKRYSLKEYTDEEKKQHRKDADEYFGHTYKWSETGYILTNGKKLDFSGRHEGGPGGYRTVDHRDIRDALGDDYGGSDYSGSMVQFMSEGNIRISPESGGINLSVMPTKNQLDSLSDFISHNRGEVILDLDTTDGQTVSSTEYPRGTHANKVLADIKAYFEDGTTPQVSSLAQFLSLKGTENAQEIAALKRENETLRQRVGYWKGQTRRSDGVRTDSKSVEKAAKELTHRYGAEIEGSDISGDLASLYDYIARGGDETGDLTYTEARSRADAIAQRIAESAIAKDDEVYREYSELRKYLKDTKITLSAEDAAGITDYADFRRRLFGKVNLGKGEHTNVDQVYSELAESYPEFFSETLENNVSDQISRIADVAGELYNVAEYNPFEGYMGQAVSSISNDILDRFFDLPQAKKTFADVQAEKLDAAKAAGRKAATDAKLAGQMAQGRTDAVKLRHTQEALRKARVQQAEKLDALRGRYREKDATRREGQKNRELRAKITRHAKDLSKRLLRPTDKQHIPEGMRSSVASLLGSINQESTYTVDADGKRVYDGSGAPTKRTQAFREMQKQYRKILQSEDGGDIVIDPSLAETGGLLDQVIDMGDRRLSELTGDELRTMWKTVRAVEHSVSTAGKVLSKSKFETTTQMADAFKDDLRTRRKKLGNNTTISLETPYTFFAHYGETGKSIYRMLRNAQDRQEVMARNVAEKVQQVLGDELGTAGAKEIAGEALHGNLKGAILDARGSAVGKWEAQTHRFTVANGGELTLTTPQIMELYLLSKRKQALGHLLGGGVYQPEIKRAQTGEKTIERGTQPVFLTEGDIDSITGKLTSEQKRVADGLQELTATTLANYGNEASMAAYGYRKFTERNYWPIKSSREGLHSNQEKDSGNVRSIKNIGMAQQVQQNANNAVELHSAFDTFANHASDMIDYAAWLTTMEDLNRFYNFRYQNEAGETFNTVKGLLDEKGGKGSQQYWQKLMGDIQNGISVKDFEPITGKMGKYVGRFKGAAVGANVRVVIQQPTAFFRASAVLDPSDMAKGMAGGVTKGSGWEKALKYSPTAMRKDVGSFDISSPYTLQERFYGKSGITDKINDLAGAAAGKADAVTWGKLWNACEWQVKREKPDVRAGSNEFYSAVNEVFTDMIDQTQVVDGILQRSNIMRGKSTLSQQATAFMGEPIMSLNVLMRSYDAFRYEENPAKRSKALKNVGRAATALVVTNVVNALAQSVIDGLRDNDRDKDYLEKLLSAFTGVEGDEKNVFELISNVALNGNVGSNINPIAQIPFAKDVLSLAQGYDVSRPDMEVFSDMVNAAKIFIDSAGGDGKKTRKEATIGLLAAASKFFGLPVSNIKRDITATLRTTAQASGSLGFQYEVEKFSYNLNNSSNKSRFISILYDALEQGDYATYEHVRRDLMEQMQLDGESIQSSLKTAYNKKLKADSGYTMPKKSLDMIGVRGKYAEDTPEEAKFSAKDLDASAYSKYESQRSDTYSAAEKAATSSGAFSRLSGDGKDKALGYADTYAKETALAANSGGKYQITTKWVLNAQEAQSKYKIAPGVFAACKAAASECESLKDADGKAIDLSKGLQIMEMLFRSGLNEQQRAAMYEYLDVPKSIRHWNRARVDEQLKIARRKAA